MVLATGLVAVVDGAVLTLIALLGVHPLLILGIGVVIAAAQLLLTPVIALAAVRARIVDAAEAPELHALVERLCQLADVAKPRIALSDADVPMAFVVGRGERSATVCVSRGLVDALDPPELAAVVAHELSHVAARDMAVMTTASLMATLSGLFLRIGFWDGTLPERWTGALLDRERRWERVVAGSAKWILAAVLGFGMILVRLLLILPLAVAVVVLALTLPVGARLSRYRELAADRGAGILTGSPMTLATALLKLERAMNAIPRRDLRTTALLDMLLVMPAASVAGSSSGSSPLTRRRGFASSGFRRSSG